MLRLIFILLFLVASVWVGLQIAAHPGYVFLVMQPWMVQMPIWFALAALLFFLLLFYLLITGIDQFYLIKFRLTSWLQIRREHKSYSKTQHGLAMLIEGRFKKAERLLITGIDQSVEPLMNYLGAAKAAHEQGAYDRRDRYLQTAYKVAPKADLAIGLTQAELQFKQGQLELAIATLNRLKQLSPRHPRILMLLEKAYVRLGDWNNLLILLPSLRKAKVLAPAQSEPFEKNIYLELLRGANTKSLNEIHMLWNSVPRHIKKHPDIVDAYVQQLLRFNTQPSVSHEIETLIRKTLQSYWQADLVRIYGTLRFANLNRQLVIVGAWLKLYGERPETLLTLARLCERLQLWGRAREYYERCLTLGTNAEATLEYNKLLEHMNQQTKVYDINMKS